MTVLALETSCDETAIAILRDDKLLASEVASQIAEHEKFGGVVPEVASRNHVAQLPRLLERAMASAKIRSIRTTPLAPPTDPGPPGRHLSEIPPPKGRAIAPANQFLP